MAEKSGVELLKFVYDFIYRLTSGAVHFNPQVLLRLGWGPFIPSTLTLSKVTFSSNNMSSYYNAINQIYGSFLLSLYFELFEGFLLPNEKEKAAVVRLREYLLDERRWPEMVTFEELNLPPPVLQGAKVPLVRAAYAAVLAKEGFVAGERSYRRFLRRPSRRDPKPKTPG